MLYPYKGRHVEEGQRVRVYRNLHRCMFSLQCAKTGRVLAHGNDFSILYAKPQVRKAGQKRAKETGNRNVHAFMTGYYRSTPMERVAEVTYDPFKDSHFMMGDNAVVAARHMTFTDGKAYAATE